jgi:hypothetical protein
LGDGLYLYNLTLQHASQITQAVTGVFAGNKEQVPVGSGVWYGVAIHEGGCVEQSFGLCRAWV